MSEAITTAGIPSRLSLSAGAYVCNHVLYTLLHHYNKGKTRVGFIHVPYSRSQNKEPSMAIEQIASALEIAIENLDL